MASNLHIIIKELIRFEYTMRSEILLSLTNHIDKLNSEHVIHHTLRSKYMNEVNNCMTKLNMTYNDVIFGYKKKNYEVTDNENYYIETNNPTGLYHYISIMKHYTNTGIKMNFFDEFDEEIMKLMKNIGSGKISDLLKLTMGMHYGDILDVDKSKEKMREFITANKETMTSIEFMRKMHNSMVLFDLLDRDFTPVEMYTNYGLNMDSILIKKFRCSNDEKYSDESNKFKYEILLDNCYRITIKTKIPNKTYVIIGYFGYDVVGSMIATSQISNSWIYHKKKLLCQYAKNNVNLSPIFKEVYLTNLSLGDILSLKEKELAEKMIQEYDLYVKSYNIKFKATVSEFLKADLLKKFNILKCLLLGPKISIKNGAMLFGITKDQNRDSKNNRSCVADILYRNLNHSQQCRLKKSGQYIKHELDRIKNMTTDDMDLKQQCTMNNNMSDHIKKCVISRLEELKSNNNDYHKNYTYAKTLVEFPWIPHDYTDVFTSIGCNKEKCREKLNDVREKLDKKVFGHEECKNTICDVVGKWFSNPNSMGKAIGLCGPPGVGKTLIASGLGEVLNIPYQEIHLGGLEDGSVLSGHSFTYSGAQPGLIVTKMVASGEPRCILFFDELDKACPKHGINEVYNVLIHATDPNTNSKFNDKFFQDVTFPLNKCIFIFSFNERSKIDPILLDRMEIIDVKSYSLNNKLIISKKFLIPELLEEIGIIAGSVKVNNKVIEHIISNYTMEAGVRGIKNKLEKILMKLNTDRIYGDGPFKNRDDFIEDMPIQITKKLVLKYLGKPKVFFEKIHSNGQIGVINGLYATTVGSGGILPIYVCLTKNGTNKFKLVTTGKQGKVMRESVQFSWTVAENCLQTNIIEKFYKNNPSGMHIHTFDGATPKDGPSAGSAFTTAFISRITGCPVKHDIAMTGEISICGNITAIGGLEYKLNGAKIAGVRLVFVCKKNIDDLKKIKENNPTLFEVLDVFDDDEVKKLIDFNKHNKKNKKNEFNIIIVETIFDIVKYALIDKEYVENIYQGKKYNTFDETFDVDKYMTRNDINIKKNLTNNKSNHSSDNY
jgi:endopeptidase La